jgi:superfamily II DNA or RNA helicase
MAEQLAIDFDASVSVRMRRAKKIAAQDQAQPELIPTPPNLDIHLHSPEEAVAHLAGNDPERHILWLQALVGSVRIIKSKRVAFPTSALDRLLHIRPPATVTLDGATMAVARAIWAQKLGYKPLKVTRERHRLAAASPRWPSGFGVKDAPWSAIATLHHLGIPLDVDTRARTLMTTKLAGTGSHIATAGLAGSAVFFEAKNPTLFENLGLPALAYAGEENSGFYKMPLLAAERLLHEPTIKLSTDLTAAIKKVAAPVKPLTTDERFPWTLFPFQAEDAARGKRILETSGGVLLAGDMGSGKTTISLALIHEMDLWPLLVVCPLSAFSTWERQLGQMGRTNYLATEAPSKAWTKITEGDYEAVVISFDRLGAFTEVIEHYGFRSIISDEIQRIRTPGSRRSRALRSLAATVEYRLGLSGTPLTNTVNDLLPLGAFLVPGEWKPRANAKDLEDLYPGDPVESVAEHLGTMMVRRRMDDTGAPLPRRNDHRVMVQLTPEQRRALADLEAEAEAAKDAGEFDDPSQKMHAFVRLHRARQIINSPSAAGIGGGNPKIAGALNLAEDFIRQGRKGVIFCADRTTFKELGREMDARGIGWVGIWGSTPPDQRIANEKRFHAEESVKVVLCTIQAGSESWSASPSGTFLISTAYVYAPSTLMQMECRVFRLSSDINGPPIEIIYMHAEAPGGSLDDRMVEILDIKKQLFAQVVDRQVHNDNTQVSYSMADLVFLLTGKRDEKLAKREADAKAVATREQAKKDHAKKTLYAKKGRNQTSADAFHDDGSMAQTLEEYLDADEGDSPDEALSAAMNDLSGNDGFDIEDDEEDDR